MSNLSPSSLPLLSAPASLYPFQEKRKGEEKEAKNRRRGEAIPRGNLFITLGE
jgi:hypothetical protein